MKLLRNSILLLIITSMVAFQACKEEVPEGLTVLGIVANGTDLQSGSATSIDLNGASAATDVPLDADIVVSFNKDVDAATANTTNVTLTDGTNAVTVSVSASGTDVTISPDGELARGLTYTLTLGGGLTAADGGTFTETTRNFTAAGRADIAPPQEAAQLAYWKLDGNSVAAVGSNDGVDVAVTYGEDRFGNMGSAAYFDGDASIIEIPNGDQLLNENFTLSYWMHVDSNMHKNAAGTGTAGHFVMGVGGLYGFFIEVQGSLGGMKLTGRYTKEDGTTTANDFFFNGDGKNKDNGGWVGVEYEVDLTATGGLGAIVDQQWTHVVITYDAATNSRSLYLNGTRMETDNLDNTTGLNTVNGLTFDDSGAAPEVIGKSLALGFVHDRTTTQWNTQPWGAYTEPGANHFKGALDDVRFFDVAYSESEVQELYNAEKN